MAASSPRDPLTVAAVVRRVDHADPAALTNAAWFAARRGDLATARSCAQLATSLRGAPADAHRTMALLDAGSVDQLLLALPPSASTNGAAPLAVAPQRGETAAQAQQGIAAGRALLHAGRVEDSLAVFDGLAQAEHADTAVLFHRGVALAKMRRYRDAMHDWHVIERADPTGPLAVASRRLAASARRLAELFTGSD